MDATKVMKEMVSTFDELIKAFERRQERLEEIEPDSEGETHDKWEDSSSELDDLIQEAEEFKDNLNEMKRQIDDYQFEYGGLKRLV